jgi:transposase
VTGRSTVAEYLRWPLPEALDEEALERLLFLAAQPACVLVTETCASANYCGREVRRVGHEVRLIAPAYVKPLVKRQKYGTADAETN